MSWRGFTCSKNALTALNVLYIVSFVYYCELIAMTIQISKLKIQLKIKVTVTSNTNTY